MKIQDVVEKGSAAGEATKLLEEAKEFNLVTAVIVGIREDGSFYLSATHPRKNVIEYLLAIGKEGIDILVAKTH